MKTYIQPQIVIQNIAPLNVMVGASNHIINSDFGIQSNGQGLGIQYAI